jgi:hypothetical protein
VSQPPAKTRTLILVNHPARQRREDFEEIRAKISTLASEIDVQIVDADQSVHELDDEIWWRPCLTVSFAQLTSFRPRRGLVYCCRPIPKFEQLAKLNSANVPVPVSAQLVFGRQLDKAVWGPLVVLKPTTPGFMSQGAVYLMRTERVADLAETVFPPGHPSRRLPVLVQKFVDTGKWPSYYRVLTLLGEPLYCLQEFTAKPRPPLDAPDEVLLKANIATNAEFGKSRPVNDADVLDLARRAYAVMPAIPLQGIDIIREQATGHLFVLETNAGGNTWHFSSKYIEKVPGQPSREERIRQFGAWEIAARVFVERTRKDAM